MRLFAEVDSPAARLGVLAAAGWSLPDWLKAAAVADLDSAEPLPGHAYADAGRTLPAHTKAAAWLSAAVLAADPEFTTDRAAPARAAAACGYFGVAGPVPPAPVKAAAAPDPACWAFTRGDFRACPVDTPGDADRAVGWLQAHRGDTTFAERAAAAGRILKTAAAARMTDQARWAAERMAGDGLPAVSGVAAAIGCRRAYARTPDAHAALTTIKRACDESPADFRKQAEVLALWDRATGCDRQPPAGWVHPEEAAWPVAASEANAKLAAVVRTPDGTLFARDELAAAGPKLAALLGGEDVAAAAGRPGFTATAAAAGVRPLQGPGRAVPADVLARWAA